MCFSIIFDPTTALLNDFLWVRSVYGGFSFFATQKQKRFEFVRKLESSNVKCVWARGKAIFKSEFGKISEFDSSLYAFNEVKRSPRIQDYWTYNTLKQVASTLVRRD